MPIRINLLAEMQALEDMRRRDPVKRAAIVGGALVAVVLLWSASLAFKQMTLKGDLSSLEGQISSGSKQYKQVLDNQQSLVDGRQRLASLNQLATNRFLIGNVLDALQKSSAENVQLI